MRSRDSATPGHRIAADTLVRRFQMFALVSLVAVAVAAIVGWARAQEAQPQLPMLPAQPIAPAAGISAPQLAYRHGQVLRKPLGQGEERVWMFLPGSPTPPSAPVVIFLHGYGAIDPYEYGGWIDHLGRSGNIVLYPAFQRTGLGGLMEGIGGFRQNAIGAVQRALDELRRFGPVQPDLSRVTMIAHSVGGQIAIGLATEGVQRGLPRPAAFLAVETGEARTPVPLAEIQQMPPSMMLLAIDGEHDQLANSRNGRKLVAYATQIPAQRRGYVMLTSQDTAGRRLFADHYAPLSPLQSYRLEKTTPQELAREQAMKQRWNIRNGEVDELDVTGFWRLGDALIRTAPNPSATIRETLAAAGIHLLSEAPQGAPVALRWSVTPQ